MKKTLFLASAITLSAMISTNSHAALSDFVPFKWSSLDCSNATLHTEKIHDYEADYITDLKAKAEKRGWSDEKYNARLEKVTDRYEEIRDKLEAFYKDELGSCLD